MYPWLDLLTQSMSLSPIPQLANCADFVVTLSVDLLYIPSLYLPRTASTNNIVLRW